MDIFHLGEKATVLRCQLARKKIGGDVMLGELPDGRMICRDISIADIGAADFVDGSNAPIVSLVLTSAARKYLLQPKDILLSYVGMAGKVGKAGFVQNLLEPALAGRSLCIVRGFRIDPIWLFYYLCQIRDKLLSMAPHPKKYGVSVLSLEDLRNLEIPMPSREAIDAANVIHADIVANAMALATAKASIVESRKRMKALFSN